jgi:hypothetical protein
MNILSLSKGNVPISAEDKFHKRVYALLIATLLVVIFDRLFFNRDLYADGSCIYLGSLLGNTTLQPLFSRIVAIEFLHLPYIIAVPLDISNDTILRFLWKIGYAVPFLIATLAISYLSRESRLFGFIYLIFSILIFYLPNSIFAVGEYQIIYAIAPVLLAAIKDLFRDGTRASKIIVFSCLILLGKTYEIAALYAFLCCFLILIIEASRKLKGANFLKVHDFYMYIFIFLVLGYFVYADIVFMPDWLKANSSAGFRAYLTWERYGALWDTWVIYQIAASISLIIIFTTPAGSKKIYGVNALILIFCITSLFANHQSEHSYTSKTIFLAVYILLSTVFIFIKIKDINLNSIFFILTPTFFAVSIFLLFQGINFEKYLNFIGNKTKIIEKSENYYVADLPYFKDGNGRAFSWSWGQACLSYIYSPGQSIIVGQFDEQYTPEKIKSLINANKNK